MFSFVFDQFDRPYLGAARYRFLSDLNQRMQLSQRKSTISSNNKLITHFRADEFQNIKWTQLDIFYFGQYRVFIKNIFHRRRRNIIYGARLLAPNLIKNQSRPSIVKYCQQHYLIRELIEMLFHFTLSPSTFKLRFPNIVNQGNHFPNFQ